MSNKQIIKRKNNRHIYMFDYPHRAAFVAQRLEVMCRHVVWSPIGDNAKFIETNATKQEIMMIPKGVCEDWKDLPAIGFGFTPMKVEGPALPVEPISIEDVKQNPEQALQPCPGLVEKADESSSIGPAGAP